MFLRFLRHGLRGIDSDGDVILHPVGITAQHFVDGLAHQFSADVIHGQVDGTFRGAISIDAAVHQFVDFFNVKRIHTDQAGTEHVDDTHNAVDGLPGNKGHRSRFSITVDALVRGHLHQQIF